jgi:hypothetical protein
MLNCITGTSRVIEGPVLASTVPPPARPLFHLGRSPGTLLPGLLLKCHSIRACISPSSPFRAAVRNECNHTSTSPIRLHDLLRGNFNFTLNLKRSCRNNNQWHEPATTARSSENKNCCNTQHCQTRGPNSMDSKQKHAKLTSVIATGHIIHVL